MKSVKNYHDSVISAIALKAMKNHMGYLTSELVGLSVFSRQLTNDQREGLAKCIIEKGSDNEEIRFEKRFGTGYGKPVFPSFEDIPEDLSYFVGEDTLTTFKYLNLDFKFFK